MQRLHSVSSRHGTDPERYPIAASQAVKPLPPLPRGWSRVVHETCLFLRGIGLGILVTSFQGIFTKNFSEPEKVAIRRSRITALLRTLIHAVPVGVAIFEIVFNFKGHFVGGSFDKQNSLQFVAKAHEIAMQASIATILFSYIRYHISIGNGMPFGAVLSGLQYLQVSYLWSVELWSSVLSKEFRLREKFCFAVLILACITVAATAGPSSANLLIARQGLWTIPSTYFAVNASFQDIWPDRLDDEKIERDCANISFNAGDDMSRCPISDLYKWLHMGVSEYLVKNSRISLESIQATGDLFGRYSWSGFCEPSQVQYCGTISQKQLVNGYYPITSQSSSMEPHYLAYFFMQKDYYQPYTVVSCVADIVKDASDQTPLRFARISETNSELEKDREIYLIPGLTANQIIDSLSGNSSRFRIDWIDLPMDIFNTGIPGAVIVHPRDPTSSSYNITTCTLNAGWGSSKIMSSTAQSIDSIFSHTTNFPPSWVDKREFRTDPHGYQISSPSNFGNFSGFSFPQRRISVSKSWIEFLNPTVVLADNSTEKFISILLSSEQSRSLEILRSTEAIVAQLLNLLLAVALSETGVGYDWNVFSDYKNATATCDTCLLFEVEKYYYGWLYSARGTTTRLALTVMLAYCTLVLGHIIYSAISGVSSTAWDSAAELVLLAMNSSPTEIAQNTCAGILGRKALKTSVKVLATTPGHLELVFDESNDSNAQISKLVVNAKYGKLTGKNEDEAEEPGSTVCQCRGEEPLSEARSKRKLE